MASDRGRPRIRPSPVPSGLARWPARLKEHRHDQRWRWALLLGLIVLPWEVTGGEPPELILHGGKIVTVDPAFRIAEAVAVRGERLIAVGRNDDVLKLAGPATRRIDLAGKTVLPGLIDSHVHALSAALYELDHTVPEMETVADVLAYIGKRAEILGEGKWIDVQQVFITRLRERRFPTRQELDAAAPRNPVIFRTGPDCALNSLAMRLSGIDKDFRITDGGSGFMERDPATGEPTGILRNCRRFVKFQPSGKSPSDSDRRTRLKAQLAAYNQVGITSICDRDSGESQIAVFQRLKDAGELTCRVFINYSVNGQAAWDKIEAGILQASRHPLRQRDPLLWVGGIKVYLDGGMLTGSAYMRQPWGKSAIYGITDPDYRGLLFIQPDLLVKIVRLAMQHNLQPTAHTVGDGAVETLVNAYEQVDREFAVREKRPCISHCNFMSPEAIEKMARLGIVADLQPAWLYLDGSTLEAHFGAERLAWFQPYKSLFDRGVIVGGGSDHMQKIEHQRSINRYNPFLGMWTTLRRLPRWTDERLHPEQAITRQQAIRLYTIQNAYLTFEEKEKGSLEPGKLADFIVLDRDIMSCPVDAIKDIEVEATYLGGKPVYQHAREQRAWFPPPSSSSGGRDCHPGAVSRPQCRIRLGEPEGTGRRKDCRGIPWATKSFRPRTGFATVRPIGSDWRWSVESDHAFGGRSWNGSAARGRFSKQRPVSCARCMAWDRNSCSGSPPRTARSTSTEKSRCAANMGSTSLPSPTRPIPVCSARFPTRPACSSSAASSSPRTEWRLPSWVRGTARNTDCARPNAWPEAWRAPD